MDFLNSLWGGVKDFGGGLAGLFTGGSPDAVASGAMNYSGTYLPDSLLGGTLADEGAGTLASSIFGSSPYATTTSLNNAYTGMAANGITPAVNNITIPEVGALAPTTTPGMFDSISGLAGKGMDWVGKNKDGLSAIGALGKGYSDWRTSQIAQDRLDLQDAELNRVNTARAKQQQQSEDIWNRAVHL